MINGAVHQRDQPEYFAPAGFPPVNFLQCVTWHIYATSHHETSRSRKPIDSSLECSDNARVLMPSSYFVRNLDQASLTLGTGSEPSDRYRCATTLDDVKSSTADETPLDSRVHGKRMLWRQKCWMQTTDAELQGGLVCRNGGRVRRADDASRQ